MKFIYYCFTFAYAVPVSVYLLWRGLTGHSGDLERLGIKLPKLKSGSSPGPIWLVASSVGEVTVAARLISALKESSVPCILSVTTAAGREQAEKAHPSPDALFYHPLDIPAIVRSVLKHYRPRSILLVETEIWPVLIEVAAESEIPVSQVSGSISARSFRRYLALKPLFGAALSSCRSLLMQTQQDARFVETLADDRTEVVVMGSVKEEYNRPTSEQIEKCRERLADWRDNIIWVGGSTRPGEEQLIIDAYKQIRLEHEKLRLVVAPRHLDRISEVQEMIQNCGAEFAIWSENEKVPASASICLVDEIGWLNALYHVAQIAFVGGTLVPVGGHNLLEPAFAGLPVLYGPFHEEQRLGHELLQEYQLGFEVDSDSLVSIASKIIGSLKDDCPYRRKSSELRERGSQVVSNYVLRILEACEEESQ